MLRLMVYISALIIMPLANCGQYVVFQLDNFLGIKNNVINVGEKLNSSFVLRGFNPSASKRTNNTNLTITIKINANDGIVVHVVYLNVLGGCYSGEKIRMSSQNKTVTFCERTVSPKIQNEAAYFYGTAVEISYITPSTITSHLQLVITAFSQGPCYSDDLFLCNSGICIYKGLVCDSLNNCGDGSDENTPKDTAKCPTHSFDEMGNFIPLFIALPLIILGVTLVLYCCIKKRQDSPYDRRDVMYVHEGDDSTSGEVRFSETSYSNIQEESAYRQDSGEIPRKNSKYPSGINSPDSGGTLSDNKEQSTSVEDSGKFHDKHSKYSSDAKSHDSEQNGLKSQEQSTSTQDSEKFHDKHSE